jgi:hypothetical protein
MEDLNFDFNKVILHPDFTAALKEITELEMNLPDISSHRDFRDDENMFTSAGQLVTPVDDICKETMDIEEGIYTLHNSGTRHVTAYDESFMKYTSLEGTAYFTSHALVLLRQKEYCPSAYLTFYFYTRSIKIVERSKYVKLTDNLEITSKKDYIRDRISFLGKVVPPRSILLIDGPLIAGDVYTIMIGSIDEFHKRDIIPIFFVKNSSSNMVTDNIRELRSKYNSDMHWSYQYLEKGERTSFFKYVDKNNPNNAKVFCYLKGYDASPQRVELHLTSYLIYEKEITNILNMVYYLLIVQGRIDNPQVRPIFVAEKYARATLALVNVNRLMKEVGITPTLNQKRFGG